MENGNKAREKTQTFTLQLNIKITGAPQSRVFRPLLFTLVPPLRMWNVDEQVGQGGSRAAGGLLHGNQM